MKRRNYAALVVGLILGGLVVLAMGGCGVVKAAGEMVVRVAEKAAEAGADAVR